MVAKRLLAASALAAVAFVPAACSSGASSGSSGEVTINVVSNFTSDVARGQVLDKLVSEFNAEHKGKIKVVSQPTADWPSLQQKIRTEISAGTPPDVFLYNYNPSDLSREKSGKLMNWAPYLNADPAWKARFPAGDLQDVTINGQIMAIPSDQAPALIYYRKDLFAKAGITSFPTTWSAFFADAQKLKSHGITPIALQTADDGWYAMNALSYLTISAGGPDAYHGTHLNTAPLVQGATMLKKLFTDAPKDAAGANYAVGSADFLDGRTAMVIDGPWLISSIQQQIHDPCNVGVATAPTNGNGVEQPGTIVTDSLNFWGAAKQSSQAKTQAIVAWMKFLTSNASAAEMGIEGQYPLVVKSTSSPAELAKANCQMKQVFQIYNNASTRIVNMERYITTAAQAQIPSLLQQLILGDISPQKFTSQLQSLNK
jgi:ABC-type glycerol-3-phosphate transport system substrate-binding protein